MMPPSLGPVSGRFRTQKLRLAFVSVHGDPLALLGTEGASRQSAYVHRLATVLARQGHMVDVFTRALDGVTAPIPVEPGYRVIQVPAGPPGYIDCQDMPPYLADFAVRVAGTQSLRRPYDLIHSHYWLSGQVGMTLAGIWGIPQVHTCHSLGAVACAAAGRELPRTDQRLQIERRILHEVAAVLASDPQETADMCRYYGVRHEVRQIPGGVDVGVFQPMGRQEARGILGLDQTRPVLTCVSRLDPCNGIETLLKAVARLRPALPVHVLIVGGCRPGSRDEAESRRLRGLVSHLELTDSVRFLGSRSPAQVALVQAAADLAIVPSLHEPFGMTAIEAMACGRPVIASRVGGLAHIVVPGETGWLVTPGRDDELADACAMLLQDPDRRQRMGLRARRRVVRDYTWQHVSALTTEVYGQVLSANKDGSGVAV
jgi:glycosyltransferase involved in cell wall biosynthesis